MLQPIPATDVRLNPLSPVSNTRTRSQKKRVQFTPASIWPTTPFMLTATARQMDDAREAKKPRIAKRRPATPTQTAARRPKASASTWRLAELENCAVVIKRGVPPSDMIPEKFFTFTHLEKFADCLHHPLIMSLTGPGKTDICKLSSEEAQKLDLINEAGVRCEHVFHAFSRMFQAQPVLRELALSRKHGEHKASQNVILPATSTGTIYNRI